MNAHATMNRRQALRNAGNINHSRAMPSMVYRGAPLSRQYKTKPNPWQHLQFMLGTVAGVVLVVGAMALADWALRLAYGQGF